MPAPPQPSLRRELGLAGAVLIGVGAMLGAGLFCGTVAALLARFGSLPTITATATLAILIYYAVANLAALRLAPEQKRYPRFVAYMGLAFCLLLAGAVPVPVIATSCLLLGAGLVARAALRRFRRP